MTAPFDILRCAYAELVVTDLAASRAFYVDVLGLTEVPKAEPERGGCWFVGGEAHLHLGVEDRFAPARKAHPALLVDDLAALVRTLTDAGLAVSSGRCC